jgi:glutamate carboxypeptidase
MKTYVLAAAMLALAGQAHAAPPKPDAKLMAAVQACDKDARSLIEQIVGIDSGTGDAEGVNAVGAILAAKFKAMGAAVKIAPPQAGGPPGDNVVATFTGIGKGRVLLVPHMDTVFSRGDVAKRKPHWEGDHYIGPGAGDDKSGDVTAVCALKAITTIGYEDFARIDVLMNASEETGSRGSHDLIVSMAKNADLILVLERGYPRDKIVAGRKGAAGLTLEFTGRAAHSGMEPEKGRNAALEAARVALLLGALGDPAKETTVTVDILQGGDKTNVVPAQAMIRADVRAFSDEEFDRVEKAAAAIAAKPGIDGVTITSSMSRTFPPWPRTAAADPLIAHANRLYGELGKSLEPVVVGGSGDASLSAGAGAGARTLDGFGMEGEGAHGVDDQAHFETFANRTYLLARMIEDVGHSPK